MFYAHWKYVVLCTHSSLLPSLVSFWKKSGILSQVEHVFQKFIICKRPRHNSVTSAKVHCVLACCSYDPNSWIFSNHKCVENQGDNRNYFKALERNIKHYWTLLKVSIYGLQVWMKTAPWMFACLGFFLRLLGREFLNVQISIKRCEWGFSLHWSWYNHEHNCLQTLEEVEESWKG